MRSTGVIDVVTAQILAQVVRDLVVGGASADVRAASSGEMSLPNKNRVRGWDGSGQQRVPSSSIPPPTAKTRVVRLYSVVTAVEAVDTWVGDELITISFSHMITP
jgi:hypothetical protein